jgi:hypothetical protein
MTAIAKFMAALEASGKGKTFVCPMSNMPVTLSTPTQLELRTAQETVLAALGQKVSQLHAGIYLTALNIELLAQCARIDGQLIPRAAYDAMTEVVFDEYVEHLDGLREAAGNSLTDEECAAALAELKKKPSTSADISNTYASSTAICLLAYLVAQP